MSQVRIGILGCARIATHVLLEPVAEVDGAVIHHVGARDGQRAQAYAEAHGIARASAGYDAVIADPDVDLVYVPLLNNLHAEWAIKALRAGKAVLCEKPFAANAAQAEAMVAAARDTGATLIEAFHYRYHPLAERLAEVVRGGAIGALRSFAMRFLVPARMMPADDPRFAYDLAGGAMMDLGCYCVDLARLLTEEEPEVRHAHADLLSPLIDYAMDVELAYPSGCTGAFRASLREERDEVSLVLDVVGETGTVKVLNPILPHAGHTLTITAGGTTTEESFGDRTSYWYQLDEVVKVVRGERPVRTPPEGGLLTMRTVDAAYQAAGLPPRGAG